jgi:long-chain fatty acid transport protein
MRRHVIAVLVAAACLLPAREAAAGGFLIYEHSALATGMADARTALWDDVSSLYYNPAAITELPGYQIGLGDTLIFPGIEYDPSLPTCQVDDEGNIVGETECGFPAEADFSVFYPVHVYFTARVTRWLALGISLNNPFGLGTFWPSDWDGRFTAWQTDLKTFFVQPTVAVNFARLAHLPDEYSVSLGVGGYYVHGTALIRSKVNASDFSTEPAEAEMKLEGAANSGGYHFSLFAAYKPWISFGASFRSNVPLEFTGTAKFIAPEDETWAQTMRMLGLLPERTTGKTTIDLPWNMNFGLAFHGIPKTTIAFDAFLAFWQSYDELNLDFACAHLEASDPDACAPVLNSEATYPKKWHMAVQLAVGAEVRPIEALALRVGYGYVSDPTNPRYYDAMLPDGERTLLTLGVGYRAPRYVKVDLGYMYAFWKGRKDNEVGEEGVRNGFANGTYRSDAHLLALSVGLSFGGPHEGKPTTLDPAPEEQTPAVLPAPEPVTIVEPVAAPAPAAEPSAPPGDFAPGAENALVP